MISFDGFRLGRPPRPLEGGPTFGRISGWNGGHASALDIRLGSQEFSANYFSDLTMGLQEYTRRIRAARQFPARSRFLIAAVEQVPPVAKIPRETWVEAWRQIYLRAAGEENSGLAQVYARGIFDRILDLTAPGDSFERLLDAFFVDLSRRPDAEGRRIFRQTLMALESSAAVSHYFTKLRDLAALRVQSLLTAARKHHQEWVNLIRD